MKNYIENRAKALAWMRGKHDFAAGIAILKAAGFKPGVVSVLERHGAGFRQSDDRLLYHMRDFIKAYANEDARQDTDLALNVMDGVEIKAQTEKKAIPSMLSKSVKFKMESGDYPESVAKVIKEYREAYVTREKLQRMLLELPESNDDVTVEKRRSISDQMKKLSDRMDVLYPQYAAYVAEGCCLRKIRHRPS